MKMRIRITSFLLVVCMIVSTLTSCGMSSWKITEDNIIQLDMTIEKGDGETKLIITYGEDIFSKIKKNQIVLMGYTKANQDIEESIKNNTTTNETKSQKIKKYSVIVDNERQITVTIKDGKTEYAGYNITIKSSAISIGKYGEATTFENEDIEKLAYEAEISGEYTTGDTNPVIQVALKNTVVSSDFNKNMVKLTGLFGNLEIDNVSGSESTITIVTKGTILSDMPFMAGVDFTAEATESKQELSAWREIEYRTNYVQTDSFALDNGRLLFNVVLGADTFNVQPGDYIACDGYTYGIEDVSDDKTTATFSCAVNASTVDEALDIVTNNNIELAADTIGSGIAQTVNILAPKPDIGMLIDYIDKTDNAGTYLATAVLYVQNGELDTIETSDISLSGDFENVSIESVKKDGAVYDIQFTFTAEELDLDNIKLSGVVSVASGKVKTMWNTYSGQMTAEVSYVTGMNRDSTTWDAVLKFIDNNKKVFDGISTVGGAISGVAGAASGIKSILEMCGVVESTDDKLDSIRRQLDDIQATMRSLDTKVSKISANISSGNAEILNAVNYNTYITASSSWNAFLSSYVNPLMNELTEYKMAFNEYMLDYIAKANTSDKAVTIYIDNNNKVTLPSPLNTQDTHYSIDGGSLKSWDSYYLDSSLSYVQDKIRANRGKLYNGYWNDVTKTQVTLLDKEGKNVVNVKAQDYFQAVQIEAAIYALEVTKASDILSAYKNFCDALAGPVGKASLTPLDNYYQMLSMYYNFYSEAKPDIETVHAYLTSILMESSGIATIAYEYTPSAESGYISNLYEKAANEIKNNTGEKDDTYCYVVGKTLNVQRVYEYFSNESVGYLTKYSIDERRELLHKYSETHHQEDYDTLAEWFSGYHDIECYDMPKYYMDDAQIRVLMSRYNNLKESGVIKSASFADYMVDLGLIDESVVKDSDGKSIETIILVSKWTMSQIPLDNSISLPISIMGFSRWYKQGDNVSVGSHGKVDGKYFEWRRQVRVDTIDIEGNSVSDHMIYGHCWYKEDHWYWKKREEWKARYSIADTANMVVFELQ